MAQAKMNFATKPTKSGEDKFDLSDPDNLFQAMFVVMVRYQHAAKTELNSEPGAEHWQSDTRWMRPILIADIRKEWLLLLGKPKGRTFHLWPWHDDYVLYCWTGLRKVSKPQKRQLCDWFGLAIPSKWLGDGKSDDDDHDD